MYLLMIVLLMAVLPILSIAIEAAASHGAADLVFLVGKWFVFWAVGVRLLLAGVRQTMNPAFTAETIFELKDEAVLPVVRELGFSNLSFGMLGVVTILEKGWIAPAAIAGGLYYGLAGIQHVLKGQRNRTETIAMISDLGIFIVLAAYLVSAFHPS